MHKKGFILLASKKISNKPESPHDDLYLFGFTLVEIMIVVAIIGLLAGLAIPSFLRSRETAFKNICINNLRQLDAAKQELALETGADEDVVPSSEELDPYIKNGTGALKCPQDSAKTFATSYNINAVNTTPTCKVKPSSHILPPDTGAAQ